jgi:NAD-dependent deacetylase
MIDFQSVRSVAVLTGAGISAESGVPTFRGEDGLWRQYRVEDLATPQAFRRNPTLVWEWYDWRRELISNCQPNQAHLTLAEMEQALPDFALITQNVDGLHRRAGSQKVVEFHGNLWDVRCVAEGTVREYLDVPLPEVPPRCRCGALLRPNVVWFGESLPAGAIAAAQEVAMSCDLMLVIGTSGVVQPAASVPLWAKQGGAYVIEINVQRTPISTYADEVILGPAAVEVPKLWAQWLRRERSAERRGTL